MKGDMKPVVTCALVCCVLLVPGCAAGGRSTPAGSPAPAVVHKTTLGGTFGSPDGMVLADGSLWVGEYGSDLVAQLDPATGAVVRTVRAGASPIGIWAGAGAVWAAGYGSAQLSKIDPASGRVTATVPVGSAPVSMGAIGHQLWVFDQGSSAATVLDPVTGKVRRTVELPVQAGFATTAAGRVWVPDLNGGSQTVIALDQRTGAITSKVRVGPYPSEVAFGSGSGWVTCKGAVYRFSLSSGAVTAEIKSPGAGFDGIALAGGSVWVGDLLRGRLDRIDPARNAITASIPLGGSPRHIVARGRDLWVALFDRGTVVHLRVPAGP